MKVIDLLNKIANGEEVPKKIKYAGIIWEYDNTTKDYISDDIFLIYKMNSFALNKSFEIIEEEPRNIEVCGSLFTRSEYNRLAGIEEDKKIEKIGTINYCENPVEMILHHKIDEIIDIINEMREDK